MVDFKEKYSMRTKTDIPEFFHRFQVRPGSAGKAVMIAILMTGLSCQVAPTVVQPPGTPPVPADYRAAMREFVRGISAHARSSHPGFIVIPQNGTELVTLTGEPAAPPVLDYLAAIDGVGREDLFYGYNDDDAATPAAETKRMQALLAVAAQRGVRALVTDYCRTRGKQDDSYARSDAAGYLSLAAESRELDRLPAYPQPPYHVNARDAADLAHASNFLYLLNQNRFSGPQAFLDALAASQYDVFIIDAYTDDGRPFTAAEIAGLQRKPNGARRLVIAYMSIGEAERYRPYWKPEWKTAPPSWLAEENPDWPGNYKVRYWDPGWQSVILGNDGYLDLILERGFDGVYLDIIDAFEYFENR